MKLPDYIDPDLYAIWCEYRLNDVGRKKWTPRSEAGFLAKAKTFFEDGYDINLLISHAMDVSWLTIWPADHCKRKKGLHRETTVTNLAEVKVNRELGQSHIAQMKAKTRKA